LNLGASTAPVVRALRVPAKSLVKLIFGARAIVQHSAPFHLVFSDIVIPGGMSGLELAQKMRSRYPELPILLTTGFSDALAARPVEFPVLMEPYEPERLSSAVNEQVRVR